MSKRYCNTHKKWVVVKESDNKCPECHAETFETRRITDPQEIRKVVKVRNQFKDFEEEIIQMLAQSGAIVEGHFIMEDN